VHDDGGSENSVNVKLFGGGWLTQLPVKNGFSLESLEEFLDVTESMGVLPTMTTRPWRNRFFFQKDSSQLVIN
jgi:hypothetical protein